MAKFSKFSLFLALFMNFFLNAQNTQRPFIWVKQEDKAKILQKIEKQDWAKSYYTEFKNRVDKELADYKKSPNDFLQKLPFDWKSQQKGKIPPFKKFLVSNDSNSDERNLQFKYLQIGIDCGVLYFLTENENYAKFALAILHSYVEGLTQMKPSEETGNGGWIYPTDHLREARVVGAQLPIIYDFVAPFIKKNKKVYDFAKSDFTEFSEENAQKVFLTYAKLAVERGHLGSNWSVLESFSLVQNALALNNLEDRKTYIKHYLSNDSDRQESLKTVHARYENEGDVFPETSGYSSMVANFSTRLMIILNKYNPSLQLGKKYYKIPFSLDRWGSLQYPNNELIRFGDAGRGFSVFYNSYEMAYVLGKQDTVAKITDKYGPLLTKGLTSGKYKRAKVGGRSLSVNPYYEPTSLLWIDEIDDYSSANTDLPRTDKMTHAGVFLQRNLSATNNPTFGLMGFVGGGHMVHGHASGMDMELYGLGEVLGVDHGKGSYRTDFHENYSRLFAAHNTIIVNGSSQGEGGWVGLGINSTQLVAMEPMPLKEALSPNHSFTRTNFLDDKGDKAEATQERTLAIIRTSPTTGYYMDVFRSKSALPNEFHDYLYHNISDDLQFLNTDLKLTDDENRYMANATKEWKQNGRYRNPGWHFFKEVQTSNSYNADVTAKFEITKLKDGKNRFMNLFILGNTNREYTKVKAPQTYNAPKPYDGLDTPTLVIRQKGEAWTNPFAVIYEPTFDENTKKGIQLVEKLEVAGIFKGFVVTSKIDNKIITQYIINQEKNSTFENKELAFNFIGSYAVITFDAANKLQNIYIGEGMFFNANNVSIQSKDSLPMAAYIDFSTTIPAAKTSENTNLIFSKK
ncbi:MAG: hypothetical protein GW772_03095 [Flavobacteriia bacterium]|nr:hypothetical protein [Flavobacteriia bacterium]NCT59666.1 hypothetical protein [Flavobacteriia bacterium]